MQYMPDAGDATVSYSIPCCIGESSYASSTALTGSIARSEVESTRDLMVPSAPDAASAEDAAENAIVFGGDVRLVGIVTTPAETRADRTGVILLNAGVVHRVGPNRLYVTLARRLAQAGLTVLRFDHSGIG